MMNKYQHWFFLAVLGGMVTLSGCATNQNLLGTDYTKEITPNSKTYFSQVWAFTDDNEFMVFGRLRLKGRTEINVPDFVEVALIDEEGKVIERQKVPYYPRMLHGKKRYHKARFTARFPETPPQGTVVRLSNVD